MNSIASLFSVFPRVLSLNRIDVKLDLARGNKSSTDAEGSTLAKKSLANSANRRRRQMDSA
jgi:hypothetical protein